MEFSERCGHSIEKEKADSVMQHYGNVLVWGRIRLATQFTPDQANTYNETTTHLQQDSLSLSSYCSVSYLWDTELCDPDEQWNWRMLPFFPLCDSHNFNFSSKKNFRLFQILCFAKQLWSQVTAFRTLFLLFKHKNFIYSSHIKHHGSCAKF